MVNCDPLVFFIFGVKNPLQILIIWLSSQNREIGSEGLTPLDFENSKMQSHLSVSLYCASAQDVAYDWAMILLYLKTPLDLKNP